MTGERGPVVRTGVTIVGNQIIPVTTPAREAAVQQAAEALRSKHYPADLDPKNARRVKDEAWTAVDVVWPLASAEGRRKAAEAIEAHRDAVFGSPFRNTPAMEAAAQHLTVAARLARGALPDEETSDDGTEDSQMELVWSPILGTHVYRERKPVARGALPDEET